MHMCTGKKVPRRGARIFQCVLQKIGRVQRTTAILGIKYSVEEWVKSYQEELDMYEKKAKQYSFYPTVVRTWDKVPCKK